MNMHINMDLHLYQIGEISNDHTQQWMRVATKLKKVGWTFGHVPVCTCENKMIEDIKRKIDLKSHEGKLSQRPTSLESMRTQLRTQPKCKGSI